MEDKDKTKLCDVDKNKTNGLEKAAEILAGPAVGDKLEVAEGGGLVCLFLSRGGLARQDAKIHAALLFSDALE